MTSRELYQLFKLSLQLFYTEQTILFHLSIPFSHSLSYSFLPFSCDLSMYCVSTVRDSYFGLETETCNQTLPSSDINKRPQPLDLL